jgi:hypothetical protein
MLRCWHCLTLKRLMCYDVLRCVTWWQRTTSHFGGPSVSWHWHCCKVKTADVAAAKDLKVWSKVKTKSVKLIWENCCSDSISWSHGISWLSICRVVDASLQGGSWPFCCWSKAFGCAVAESVHRGASQAENRSNLAWRCLDPGSRWK